MINDKTSVPAPVADEREAFECDWLRRHYPLPMNTRLRDDGRYGDHIIQGQFEAWCAARAALAATPAVCESVQTDDFGKQPAKAAPAKPTFMTEDQASTWIAQPATPSHEQGILI